MGGTRHRSGCRRPTSVERLTPAGRFAPTRSSRSPLPPSLFCCRSNSRQASLARQRVRRWKRRFSWLVRFLGGVEPFLLAVPAAAMGATFPIASQAMCGGATRSLQLCRVAVQPQTRSALHRYCSRRFPAVAGAWTPAHYTNRRCPQSNCGDSYFVDGGADCYSNAGGPGCEDPACSRSTCQASREGARNRVLMDSGACPCSLGVCLPHASGRLDTLGSADTRTDYVRLQRGGRRVHWRTCCRFSHRITTGRTVASTCAGSCCMPVVFSWIGHRGSKWR